MRIAYLRVFVVTLFVAWACLASTGDFNFYIAYPDKKVIKDYATVFDRFFWAGLYAILFATADIGALWVWDCVRKLRLKVKRMVLVGTLLVISLPICGLYRFAQMPSRSLNTFFGALELQVLWTWIVLLAIGWLGILFWFVFTFLHKSNEHIS